jgi:hypothetical protein
VGCFEKKTFSPLLLSYFCVVLVILVIFSSIFPRKFRPTDRLNSFCPLLRSFLLSSLIFSTLHLSDWTPIISLFHLLSCFGRRICVWNKICGGSYIEHAAHFLCIHLIKPAAHHSIQRSSSHAASHMCESGWRSRYESKVSQCLVVRPCVCVTGFLVRKACLALLNRQEMKKRAVGKRGRER